MRNPMRTTEQAITALETERCELKEENDRLRAENAELQKVLRDVVSDLLDYEHINRISPNPGPTHCWDSVAKARAILAKTAKEEK